MPHEIRDTEATEGWADDFSTVIPRSSRTIFSMTSFFCPNGIRLAKRKRSRPWHNCHGFSSRVELLQNLWWLPCPCWTAGSSYLLCFIFLLMSPDSNVHNARKSPGYDLDFANVNSKGIWGICFGDLRASSAWPKVHAEVSRTKGGRIKRLCKQYQTISRNRQAQPSALGMLKRVRSVHVACCLVHKDHSDPRYFRKVSLEARSESVLVSCENHRQHFPNSECAGENEAIFGETLLWTQLTDQATHWRRDLRWRWPWRSVAANSLQLAGDVVDRVDLQLWPQLRLHRFLLNTR